jgi:guanylate cyclase soluble subunit beta
MYGLIHIALSDMIVAHHGDATWQQILVQAEVEDGAFMRMRSYDDSTTYALIGATAKVLDATVGACLEAFGEHWLHKFAPRDYEILLQAAGNDLFTFLENLDALHDHISTTFVSYMPPSFGVERHSETTATLHYISSRQGLVPFVIGMIRGMQDRFNVDITIDSIASSTSDSGERAAICLTVRER